MVVGAGLALLGGGTAPGSGYELNAASTRIRNSLQAMFVLLPRAANIRGLRLTFKYRVGPIKYVQLAFPDVLRADLEHYTDKSGGPDACWLWTGKLSSAGYGSLYFRGSYVAHRAALGFSGVKLTHGDVVCHTCDNRKCVNPAHLYVGTPKMNVRDAWVRGRLPGQSGGRKPNSLEVIARRQTRREVWEEAHQIEPEDLSGLSIG